MALSDFVTAVVAVLRRRPADLLPMYVLGVAVTAIVRVVPFVAIAIAYIVLATTGRLESIRTALTELGSPPTDPNADPEAFETWANGLEPIVDQLLTPQLVVLGLGTVLVSVLLFALLSAGVAAGQLTACYSRLRDNRGLLAGVDGARRYWLRFLGLFLLELLCWIAVLVTVGFGAVLLAGAGSLATGSMVVAPLAVLLAMLVALVVLLVVRALFAFAPVAVVVDDAGVFASLWRAAGFVRRQPVDALFYYIVALVALVGVSSVVGLLSLVDVVTIGSLVSTLVLLPALDLLKTAIYCGYRDRLAPPEPPTESLRQQLRGGLRRGWTEMTSFVRATPGTHALVVGLALLGFWVGWMAAEPFVGTFEASIATRLEGWLPPAMALELFGNNWLVALTTAYAGVAFAIPAVISLLFNGIAIGIAARLEVDPTELAAFMVPHGIVEIPAILIASALGISVGATAWRTWQGRASRTDFADALERAFWVLVGIGILLAIAAVIEGFVSPYYYRLFL
ncbi:stage II sporulation protein M [Natrinema salaciae]|uniref:Stage II sporulation protein M n=1 Tax=Natrinema salaciae TaxID=1186196 RepID=A0A1H8ZI86_9EURY|nr:stage II sporulation protein M [Natrinema salaciae]SEP64071.1 Stage II sporulation protein M [Natrinema salaciae]